ncbi:hypothetical protein ACMXYV_05635 [Neptuniibacter sp. SY11_33]|uniref:hypothetical protein n=1 Tax=Neptuniibacter sp. SY11_33 TaxID=3398215 RepID=UPI0039F47C60
MTRIEEGYLDDGELEKLFPRAFLSRNSCFTNLWQMLHKCKMKSALYPDTQNEHLDRVIKTHTSFNSWKEMYETALEQYADDLCSKVDDDLSMH